MNEIENENEIREDKPKKTFSGFLMTALLVKNKWYIIGATVLAAVVSLVYSLCLPNWYAATANVVPPKNAGNMLDQAMGGLSSALKEAGLSKLTGKNSGSDYNFLVILNSRSVADSIIKKYDLLHSYITKPSKLKKTKPSDIRKMFSKKLEITLEPDGNYTITILDKDSTRVAAMVNDYIYYTNELAKEIYQSEVGFNKNYLEVRLSSLDSTLNIIASKLSTVSRTTGIISPEEQAKAYVNAVSNIKSQLMLQQVYYESYKTKYGENDQQTQNQKEIVNSLSNKLNEAENKPGLAGNFTAKDATSKGIDYVKLYAEYESLTKLKLLLEPMLEEAKINEGRDLLSLSVVDRAITPDKKAQPKRGLIVAGSALGGFFVSILVILMIYGFKSFNIRYKRALKVLDI